MNKPITDEELDSLERAATPAFRAVIQQLRADLERCSDYVATLGIENDKLHVRAEQWGEAVEQSREQWYELNDKYKEQSEALRLESKALSALREAAKTQVSSCRCSCNACYKLAVFCDGPAEALIEGGGESLRDGEQAGKHQEPAQPCGVKAWAFPNRPALVEVGNKLADYLLRALPDMESFGSKTDLERADIKKWKGLVEGINEGREVDCKPRDANDRPALDCPTCRGTFKYDERGTPAPICPDCGKEPKE